MKHVHQHDEEPGQEALLVPSQSQGWQSIKRPVQERIRQRREALQDMARPLKQWLYMHKDNPYPTKSEKVQLALSTHMSLTQVSNWFANARRRLKNTVTEPGVTWARRIRLYNNYVVGNAELLSISSGDEEDEEEEQQVMMLENAVEGRMLGEDDLGQTKLPGSEVESRLHPNLHKTATITLDTDHVLTPTETTRDLSQTNKNSDGPLANQIECTYTLDSQLPLRKNLLERYLNDTCSNYAEMNDGTVGGGFRKRSLSGSLGSPESDAMSAVSSRGSPLHSSTEERMDDLECIMKYCEDGGDDRENGIYWKEISAALALTALARSRWRP